ncbi:hypothetical protein LAUMK13_04538 [Mycobacterium innocens]|uniref:Uncharacterized protein n=1 Tax=Mycobacterium innocens TaxID=2341083 RepID=A0A498QFT4_9MYCO|nr:hypothetical protein LAUMK13_04538 [Mycobacterium innocens]
MQPAHPFQFCVAGLYHKNTVVMTADAIGALRGNIADPRSKLSSRPASSPGIAGRWSRRTATLIAMVGATGA